MLPSSIIGIMILIIFVKLIGLASKTITKLVINSLLGILMLYIVNTLGNPFGLQIPISWFNGFLVGIFGIPAIILLSI